MPHLKWQLNTTGSSQLVSKTASILSLNSLKQSLKIASMKKVSEAAVHPHVHLWCHRLYFTHLVRTKIKKKRLNFLRELEKVKFLSSCQLLQKSSEEQPDREHHKVAGFEQGPGQGGCSEWLKPPRTSPVSFCRASTTSVKWSVKGY